MAYVGSTNDVLLFGGLDQAGDEADTWTWRAGCWTQKAPATSPPALESAAMAYDPQSHMAIMYGGLGTASDGHRTFPNTTWSWDGTNWAQISNGPALQFSLEVYDYALQRVVLIGWTPTSAEVWTWEGSAWKRTSVTSSPSPRSNASIAYDASTKQIVLFGGVLPGTSIFNDTWTWNGSSWTKQEPSTSPPPQFDASMAYFAPTSRIVLFSGRPDPGKTWIWDGVTWSQSAAVSSPGPIFMATAIEVGSRVLLFGGFESSSYQNSMWSWDGTAWSSA